MVLSSLGSHLTHLLDVVQPFIASDYLADHTMRAHIRMLWVQDDAQVPI